MNILAVLAVVLLSSVSMTQAQKSCKIAISTMVVDSVSGNIWRIKLPWNSENPTCNKVELKEETPGSELYQTIWTSHCEAGNFCYFNATIQSGQYKHKWMKFATNCTQDCQGTSTQPFTFGLVTVDKRVNVSVPNCDIRINTSTCIESGQNITVDLASVEGHTYRYTISVEGTSQQVLEGSVDTSQGGDIRGFMLESTDTLAVGRYILTVTEEETGCRGYGRFLVGASGDISPEVKYRANAEHDGMYVCLDPGEGVSFANSLTAKVGSGAKTTLRGKGNCFTQSYTGEESTLSIVVRKNGKLDGQVKVHYIGRRHGLTKA